MKINRSSLDPFGFVLPAEAESHRAQIPRTFFKFAGASSPVKIPQKNGRNIEVSGGDLIAVFSVMRSKPASHRWKGDTVIAELAEQNVGKNKVRAILKYLNDEGWIRYIELPRYNGEHGGSVIEVQYRRLPKGEAGRKRRIAVDSAQGVRMFEKDGKTEVRDAKARRTFIVPDRDPDHPYGRDDVEEDWQPYTRPSGARSSDVPGSIVRPSGNEYKDHLDKDHEIEESPSVPQAEPGEPGSFGSEEEGVQEGPRDSLSEDDRAASSTAASPPGGKDDVRWIAAELRRLGVKASDSSDDRARYEVFLLREFLPRLSDPPSPTRWTTEAARSWGEMSLKAKVLLELCSDGHWSDNLLRSFGKRSASYSDVEFRDVLMGFDWKRAGNFSLDDLVYAGKSRWNNEGWIGLKTSVSPSLKTIRSDTEQILRDLQADPWQDDEDVAEQWKRDRGKDPEPLLRAHPGINDVFQWLYDVWVTGTYDAAISGDGAFAEVVEKFSGDLMNLLAVSRRHLLVASSVHQHAGDIWGIDWGKVRTIHGEKVDSLNLRAQNFGLDPVEPLFELIDFPFPKNAIAAESKTEVVRGAKTSSDEGEKGSIGRVPTSDLRERINAPSQRVTPEFQQQTQDIAASLLELYRSTPVKEI